MAAVGALCMCGHRQGIHEDKGAYCNRCDCMEFEANTEVPVMETPSVAVPEPVADSVPKPLPVVDPPKPKPPQTPPKSERVDGLRLPSKPEAGTWRALVEDLSTGAVYLVARGSKKFASQTLSVYIDANPLPLTKRGVLSMDHEYVKARDDAPFFRAES